MTDETSHILISYKREDETRVARLIRALQHHGLVVWWDQGLPGGEEWRANIERALDRAGCVIVVWSQASTGPGGGFVRDEASRALRRGVLIPVFLDHVRPPLGFGEVQGVDLVHWRGGPEDLEIVDLVALCRARLENAPAPAAQARANRLLRRAAFGSGAFATILATAAIGLNIGSAQDVVCALPVPQPWLSDSCGALGLGHRASSDERVLWAARPPRSCDALRDYLRRYPNGAHRLEAISLLQSARPGPAQRVSNVSRTIRGFLGQSGRGFASELDAATDAHERVANDARDVTCQPLASYERLLSATVTKVELDCRRSPLGAWRCAADYSAQCELEARASEEVCG